MPQYSGMWTLSQVSQAVKNQTWTGLPPSVVEYLIVAGGGGGGGRYYAGGGGAGGLLAGHTGITPGTSYFVTVGAGGAGGAISTAGTNGGVSVLVATSSAAVTGNIVALGGGGGGGYAVGQYAGVSGGSGGGSGEPGGTGAKAGGSGTSGQGNAGGTCNGNGSGGGGAGTVGVNGGTAANTFAGAGGAGIVSAITGTASAYAGGGGGGVNGTGYSGIPGGVGGGGAGAGTGGDGVAGNLNTGGGGGGGGGYNLPSSSGAGGSGVVIVRYPGSVQYFTGGIVWASASGYVIHWFLSSATLTPTTPTALTVQPAYPVAIGDSYGGGYFAGQIKDGGVIYNLVVAPKASGYAQTGYAWDSTGGGSTTGATSVTNGQTNTATIPAIARYAAAQYVKALNIGGYTDWYLPSIEELGIAWFNLKPLTNDNYGGASAYSNFTGNVPPYQTVANWPSATIPAQTTVTAFKTGGSEAWAGDHGWTSTETSTTDASFLYWGTGVPGYQSTSVKTQSGYSIRGFRRVVA